MNSSKQHKYDAKYLEMAQLWSHLSTAKRSKVGALLINDGTIIADGYTPTGFENECEDEENNTKWYVLHAEANAILKVARSTQSCENSTLYLTMSMSPCKDCAKLIVQAGIKRVLYSSEYRDITGVDFLKKVGIEFLHFT